MGLRARLLMLLVCPMVLAMGGYGAVRLAIEEQQLIREEQDRMSLVGKALQVAVETALRDRDERDVRRLVAEVVHFQDEIDRIRLFDPDLRPVLVSNPLAIGEEVPASGLRRAMEGQQPVSELHSHQGRSVLYTLVPLRSPDGRTTGAMEIVRLAKGIEARIRASRIDLLQRIGLLTLLVGGLLWGGARWSVILPIRRLTHGVRALAAGRPEPIPVRGRDELSTLAGAFNELTERLASARQQLETESEARLDLARQLRQAEHLAVAGRIASEVAHEVSTPLNVISGRTEQLLRTVPADDPRATPLRTILAQIDRIRGILTSLLDLVRPRKPDVRAVALREPLQGIVDFLRATARARGLDLVLSAQGAVRALVDPNQLQQVLINLVMNAIEAAPAGSRVTLSAVRSAGPGGEPGVELTVADRGPGISPEHLARVFDPFFTTKPPGQGTGLGLAICRDIVSEHGGRIDIDSRVGAGTTVRVWLPAGPEEGS